MIIYPGTTEHTFFSSTHERATKRVHILVTKKIPTKLKRRESVKSVFSNPNGKRLEINSPYVEKSQNV